MWMHEVEVSFKLSKIKQSQMKIHLIFIIFSFNTSIGQIINHDFEQWDSTYSYETPIDWYCNGVWFGACRKVFLDLNQAVRMDNSLPCTSMDPPGAESLGNGDLSQYFKVPGPEFMLQYDLTIDTIDAPASFEVKLIQPGVGIIFNAEHNELFEGNVNHKITIDPDIDSLIIQFEPIGYQKEMSKHDCDLGFISVVLDNVKAEIMVNNTNVEDSKTTIHPNPSDGLIFIDNQLLGIEKIKVIDYQGREIVHLTVISTENPIIDLTDLQGFFILQLYYLDGHSEATKIIIN